MLGYLLILVLIILGGAIATVGDRIGSRVGKARLSLFNLRPKHTAVVVTVLTGGMISALTLGMVFAFSQQFRDALFRYDEIQKQSRIVKEELNDTQQQKDKIEGELATARSSLKSTVDRLRTTNRSLVRAVAREKRIETQLKQLQSRYAESKQNLTKFVQQAGQLRIQIQTLVAQQQNLKVQRNQSQARLQEVRSQKQGLETAIAQAQRQRQQVEAQKKQLLDTIGQERQQLQAANQERQQLEQEVLALATNRERLEQDVDFLLKGLRQGTIAIRTGQVLAAAVVENSRSREEAFQAVNALLLQARQSAISLAKLQNVSNQEQIVQVSRSDVDQLVQRISDGRPYVLRILAAGSYLQGERAIFVFSQVAPNRVVYEPGTQLVQITIDPSRLTDEELLAAINQLFSVVKEQGIVAGILPDPLTEKVGTFRQIELFRFLLALKDRTAPGPIDIVAITSEQVSTLGPLAVELIAIKDQEIILRSRLTSQNFTAPVSP
ncbi:MAG: DUF3084 domain-containing protein [Acaryochloridaceae cyanobacterium SU_2_1]|nr:DUF3084 domain-containing protein [Acaryochloridaceae cyanobacterium SU_2_1]